MLRMVGDSKEVDRLDKQQGMNEIHFSNPEEKECFEKCKQGFLNRFTQSYYKKFEKISPRESFVDRVGITLSNVFKDYSNVLKKNPSLPHLKALKCVREGNKFFSRLFRNEEYYLAMGYSYDQFSSLFPNILGDNLNNIVKIQGIDAWDPRDGDIQILEETYTDPEEDVKEIVVAIRINPESELAQELSAFNFKTKTLD